ncbi:MAG: hypothetical protein M3361_18730, partial [Candidatus Tectomicrobia bacterium]|nr:hypothetical protein [Candidatus Tectomicrobia bacterium]
MVTNLLERKRTHFVLWAPQTGAQAPKLIIGELQATNPVSLTNERALDMADAPGSRDLWELAAAQAGLQGGKVYHYWFEVADRKAGRPPGQRVRVTDPAAFAVDWR